VARRLSECVGVGEVAGVSLTGSLKTRDRFLAALQGRTEYGRAIAKAKPVRGAGERYPSHLVDASHRRLRQCAYFSRGIHATFCSERCSAERTSLYNSGFLARR